MSKYVRIIHHAANIQCELPPNSYQAVEACIEAGVKAMEVDILPTIDGEFLLLHDQNLESHTDGKGNASLMSRSELEKFCYKLNRTITNQKLTFLDDIVKLIALKGRALDKIQLDLKPFSILSSEHIHSLIERINPIFDKVQISSVADWLVRTIHRISPTLNLGFDPLLYLDSASNTSKPASIPPFRVGAYGCWDDHPLSAYKWGTHQEYFRERAACLFSQAEGCKEWFIKAETLLHVQQSGFDWIDYLHTQGCSVDIWTIDADSMSLELAKELIHQGIDEITSNNPSLLAKAINFPSVF